MAVRRICRWREKKKYPHTHTIAECTRNQRIARCICSVPAAHKSKRAASLFEWCAVTPWAGDEYDYIL